MSIEIVIEDIPEKYKPIVDIVGLPVFIKLCDYARGDKLYFPMNKTIESNAKKRIILTEYNGYNVKELADKCSLTVTMVRKIIRDNKDSV